MENNYTNRSTITANPNYFGSPQLREPITGRLLLIILDNAKLLGI